MGLIFYKEVSPFIMRNRDPWANHLPAFASASGVLVQFLMLTFVRKFEVLELALFFFLSSLFAAAAVAPVLSAATAAAAW